ncbi:hypothetical protein V1278_002581 [Bradyrhizobium sp. AZCC 1577]
MVIAGDSSWQGTLSKLAADVMLLRAGSAGRPRFQGDRCQQPGAGRVRTDGPRARQNVSHKKVVITVGDSGIGRAVAIAYAREGADVLISYLDERRRPGDRAAGDGSRQGGSLLPGDIQDPGQCRAVVAKAVSEFGGIDILVNNAARQASFKSIEDISDEEWELTFKENIHAMFYLKGCGQPHEAG